MQQPSDNSHKKIMVLISTVAFTLTLLLIIVFAAFSPMSPEAVVSAMLEGLSEKNFEMVESFVAGPAQADLQAVPDSQDYSQWQMFWENGEELFGEFRVGEVKVSGNRASVFVFYGPGLIREVEFVMEREKRQWKVIDLNN